MADIIDFPSEHGVPFAANETDDAISDGFLRDEGLDLLASFRVIKDTSVRASLLTLVRNLAQSALALPAD